MSSIPSAGSERQFFPNVPISESFKHKDISIQDVACRVFALLFMGIQYVCILGSTLIGRCLYLPLSLPRKYIVTPTYNIANPLILPKCIKTAMKPYPKDLFASIGITHDIVYHPASGLCLGMCLNFLSKYHLAMGTSREKLLTAAEQFRYGANEPSVMIQALYDDLLDQRSLTPFVGLKSDPLPVQPTLDTIEEALAFLRTLNEGSYLLNFPNHAVALVKSNQEMAVFDPNSGLAIVNDMQDQNELLTHLLDHYSVDFSNTLQSSSILSIRDFFTT